MSDTGKSNAITCELARELVHRVLDGELMDATDRRELDSHLVACAGCRQANAELQTIQQALRSLPAASLPDAALREVWNRTTKSATGNARGGRRIYDWGVAAAAAILAFALLGVWELGGPGTTEPTRTELDRATAQARMVLGLTADALRKTERTAFEKVLAEEVSPALKSVPIQWPGSSAGRRKSRNEV